jgi:mono/diheme cytochrome c family protein
MRRLVPAVLIVLAACTTGEAGSGHAVASSEPAPTAQPGGVVRLGDSFASMSEQYSPRAGPFAATGASAWVRPAPAPAFLASGPPPPPDAPAPDPIAALSQAPAPPAADIARAEAAAPEVPSAPNPALRAAGLALFNSASCSACHAFADAGAGGAIGPSLDRNPRLDKAFAIDVISHGRGAMPSFAGQLSDAEIATLADYLVAFSRK